MKSKVVLRYELDVFLSKYPNLKKYHSDKILNESISILKVFENWGFNSFHALKTIVKRFYPEVNEKELLELYQLKVIREDVLKYVHYTYQILNV
jgi:hypothetical protein